MSVNQLNPPPFPSQGRFDATVLLNRTLCRDHFLLRLSLPRQFKATHPGQFIQLGCRPPADTMDGRDVVGRSQEFDAWEELALNQPELSGELALLRRPFSISGRSGLDEANGASWIEVIHRVVGTGTTWLAALRCGDPVDLIGPLGNGFELPPDKSLGLLVGGGVGLPPMFYLAQRLHEAGWQAICFVGATTQDLLPVTFVDGVLPVSTGSPVDSVNEFARFGYSTVVTTNDGSCGLRGLITEGLQRQLDALSAPDRQRAMVFTCGPELMMRATADISHRGQVDCQVCLEKTMACGMGTCQSCVARIETHAEWHGVTAEGRSWRYRLTCTDGPVFDAHKVVW